MRSHFNEGPEKFFNADVGGGRLRGEASRELEMEKMSLITNFSQFDECCDSLTLVSSAAWLERKKPNSCSERREDGRGLLLRKSYLLSEKFRVVRDAERMSWYGVG